MKSSDGHCVSSFMICTATRNTYRN